MAAPARRLRRVLTAIDPCKVDSSDANGGAPSRGHVVDSTIGWPEWLPQPEYAKVPRFSIEKVRGQGERDRPRTHA